MTRRKILQFLFSFLIILSNVKAAEWNGNYSEGWQQFNQLINDRKGESAAALVGKMLETARSTRNNSEWTICLIRYSQLRIALDGYETAVRFLKEQGWPDDMTGSSVLNLYYAQALATYAHSYSWEINKRERVDTKGAIDLKSLTRDQIFEEAQKAYEIVWQRRSQLGDLSVNQWKDYITPNTYPSGIRPTLRDAVSYLRVEALANTNGWSPEQLNEIYRLNLKRLIAGDIGELSLVDPSRHPLERIGFILADLENWHAQRKEREAALEARLERLRQLYSRFSNAMDRKLIQTDLEKTLAGLTDAPWWTEGMAQLAEFVRMEQTADALVRARETAIKGRNAFPDSIGGKHCYAIVKSIEAPMYSLEGMANDNPQKKSILVSHQNLEKIYFRAYAIDLLKTIENADAYSLLPTGRALDSLVAGGSQVAEWETPLSAAPDLRMHKTFIVPPLATPGTYLIVASARPGFPKEDNLLKGIYLTVGDLVIVSRIENGKAEATIFAGSSGKPIAGVDVILYTLNVNNKWQPEAPKLTDKYGAASFIFNTNARYIFFARKGNQSVFDSQSLSPYRSNREKGSTIFFTDRSIYRPQQKLFWKAVLYERTIYGTHIDAAAGRSFTVSLFDKNHQLVTAKEVTSNEFGSASGEFVIPAGRALGSWLLESSMQGSVPIRVEEYKRPTFEAKLLDPENPLRLNQQAELKGEARYYFGLPVASGVAKWSVTREPEFSFRWRLLSSIDTFGFYSITQNSQNIASGTAEIKPDGTFSFSFLPEIDERLGKSNDVSYRYMISVDITDEGGETRSAKRLFRLGFVSIEASANLSTNFFSSDDPIKIPLQRNTLDGVGRKGKGSWRIVSLKEPAKTLLPVEQTIAVPKELEESIGFQTPGDRERRRWNLGYAPETVLMQWEEGQTKGSGAIIHDEQGKGEIVLGHLAPGAFRLIYETLDDFGAQCRMQKEFIVASPSLRLALPGYFAVKNDSLKVGETASILIHSGLVDQPITFEMYQDGKRLKKLEMVSGKDPSIVKIPITEAHRGGIRLVMSFLRDNQFIQFQRSLMVPWDNKELKVEFSTFRDKLHPGKEETLSVQVSDPKGKDAAVPAIELLSYMYDRSLDYLAPHIPMNPLQLFPNRSFAANIRTNLNGGNQLWLSSRGFNGTPQAPVLEHDHLISFDSYAMRRLLAANQLHKALPPPRAAMRMAVGVPEGVAGGIVGDFVAPASIPNQMLETSSSVGMTINETRTREQSKLALDSIIASEPSIQLRSDFSETAFWKPHLLTGPDVSVTFEFKVPDSVTSWNVWVHAITKDFKSGSAHREARSVKELMVRPYLPRFLREGDQAEIKVVVNNASEKELKGQLNFDIIDPATDQSVLTTFGLTQTDASGKPFTIAASGSTTLSFPIKTPSQVGQIAFKVTASSGDFTDGELRPIPILPGRMHLMQSKFVTLKDQSQRVMRFDDLLKNDDPTRINEQMVVTLDAQLFYSVLSALPYLVNYPYECTEQTLNRFLSTGILSSLYKQYPAVEKMAKEFSSRQTQLEQWNSSDPNRKMALEETPWVQMAEGGLEGGSINVLDSRITNAQRESALARLREIQTSSGGFPWFGGGPPSPYITLYLLNGFSKALEFGVDVPRDVTQSALNYMHRHYLDDVVKEMISHDSGWEFVTFINYVLSNFPDESWYKGTFTAEERKTMLDFSFKHWKSHSPYLKGYLALTLKRMGRAKDAMLVWESVMDSAKTAEDQGTFWAPEDRSWLWYNDTIESHAFAIRADMELIPADPKLDGMVLWLFLNKKMNHWKSTRATAEVIYSLAHYLKKTEQLGIREDATVTVGNQKTTFVFEPDQYTGKKNQIIIPGEKIDPAKTSTVTVEKTSKGHMFASATWHYSTEELPSEERGDYLRLTRTYFKRVNMGKEYALQPLKEGAAIATGDEVEVHLSLTSKHPMEYVHLRDPRAAGFEPSSNISKHKWDLGLCWYEEIRDSGTNFFFEQIPQGEFTFKYRIRAATAGTFKVAPATVQPMYAPEFAAFSTGAVLKVE